MKRLGYKRLISPAVITLILGAIAVVGCGNKSVANDKETDEVETVAQEQTPDIMEKPTGERFQLKGKVEDGKGKLIVLQKLDQGQLSFVDSIRADDKGRYEFNASSENPMFYYITVNSVKPPGVPVILENGKSTELNLKLGDLIETTVKGDESNTQLKSLYDIYQGHNRDNAAFQSKYANINPKTVNDSTKKAINSEYSALQKKMSSEIMSFVTDNPGGPATYFAAIYVVPKPSPTLLGNALKKMQSDAPESLFTKRLEDRINSISALDVGGLAPDIELKSPEGELVKLSSLRGKVVLIDFWASWCRPCRAENPNVVRVFNKYHEKGFEVFSVSLDNNAARWKAAIAQDGLTWTHVSDLRGWKSSAAALYQVSGIPKTFLLDENGRILAKDLRGPQLEAKLAEIFN
ncbi:MAG: AhpC/TSA family protein [Bacteroidia bacterium]|nr:AhpC/TSA family protein [Bacteroidia bacterium]